MNMGCESTIFAAERGSELRFFASETEIPRDWKFTGQHDIFDVMTGRHCTKEQALVIVNADWWRQLFCRRR
jgi:hypothetical protein